MSSQICGFPSAFSWGCQAPWCLTTPPPKPLPPLHRSSWPPSSVKLSMMETSRGWSIVCKEPEENCWLSYKVLRIGGRVQATHKKSHKLGKYRRCPTEFQHQSRALFKSSPNNPLKSWCENPPTYHLKNFASKLSPKIKALPEGPAVVPKPKIRAKAALVAPEATNRAALALTGASCRFPLEGTTPVEMWEQLTKKTEAWWQIF